MRINTVTSAEFAADFGTESVTGEDFLEYISTDLGIGVIKDTRNRTVEFVTAPNADIKTLTPEQELAMLSLVCGDYTESDSVEVPKVKEIEEYEKEGNKTRLIGRWIVIACIGLFVIIGTTPYWMILLD